VRNRDNLTEGGGIKGVGLFEAKGNRGSSVETKTVLEERGKGRTEYQDGKNKIS